MISLGDFLGSIFSLAIWLGIGALILMAWGYNKLRQRSENVKSTWANISVVARKKIALVNQLIDVVKSYQDNEQLVVLKVSEDQTVAALQQSYQQSGSMLAQIATMAQRFPELKSSAQYSRLIDSIQASENELQHYRTNYNAVANEYNVLRTSIPHVFYAQLLGFSKAEYLTMEASELADAGMQKPMVSDDGERVKQLLGNAGSRVASAASGMMREGRRLAEQATRVPGAEAGDGYTYLDANMNKIGPVSIAVLQALYNSGAIQDETQVQRAGSTAWLRYNQLGGGFGG